jgi:4-alpha-glucanotransferase
MKRASGILVHLTSFPSSFGIGDMGEGAFKFADFLHDTGQSYLQILPLTPTEPFYDNSPYHGISAFAGNPLLISPQMLVEQDLLKKEDIENIPEFSNDSVEFNRVIPFKKNLLDIAFANFKNNEPFQDLEDFIQKSDYWLEDFSLFMTLKKNFDNIGWNEWPEKFRNRDEETLKKARVEFHDEIMKQKFIQYLFEKQWRAFRNHLNGKNIQIIGDIPIYVDFDSSDVWVNTEIFKLNSDKKPIAVSGVPPDYFSSTGQLWGNPVYNWGRLKETDYDWWIKRFRRIFELVDIVRIDHFRGLVSYWEVPYGEKTAINGRWVEAPIYDFMSSLKKQFAEFPVIAEDLGIITPDVTQAMNYFNLPGMKVLLFAFGEDNSENPYLPHNYSRNSVVYTGTHDNNTVRGWFESEAKEQEKLRFSRYIGREVSSNDVNWEFIRLAMASVANISIIPMHDFLGLGEEGRMNLPGTMNGNWRFRFPESVLTDSLKEKILALTKIYGRIG